MTDITTQIENIDKLIAALESGDYAKGRNTLTINDGHRQKYCCLGVLAALEGYTIPADKTYVMQPPGSNQDLDVYPLDRDGQTYGLTHNAMIALASANDSTETWDQEVIPMLRNIQDNLRAYVKGEPE